MSQTSPPTPTSETSTIESERPGPAVLEDPAHVLTKLTGIALRPSETLPARPLAKPSRMTLPPAAAPVIVLAVRSYLRYTLSHRDVVELLAERGIDVDHIAICRWVHRCTPQTLTGERSC